jgi:hypothetical protein
MGYSHRAGRYESHDLTSVPAAAKLGPQIITRGEK